jgi:hypothetical protein
MANMISLSRRNLTIVPDLTDIGGLSRAAAAVVTWTGHGLVTGDHVSFQGITQADWTALNGNSYAITWLTANTFSIPFNSSGIAVAYNVSVDPGLIGTDFDSARVQSGRLPIGSVSGTFVEGETVTQATSGATGVVRRVKGGQSVLFLVRVVGAFDTTHTVTGGTSSATAVPSSVEYIFPNGIRLTSIDFASSQTGDTLTVRDSHSYGAIISPRHRDTDNSGFPRHRGGLPLRSWPYIKASEQDWGVPANVQIVLEFT